MWFVALILVLLVASPGFRKIFIPLICLGVIILYAGVLVISKQPHKAVVVQSDTDYSVCHAITDDSKNLECLFAVASGEGYPRK